MEYMLETKALVKKYGKFSALDSVSIHVPKGAIYGLVGKNGAGKTTLMRTVCGLVGKSSGEYAFYSPRVKIGAIIEKPAVYMNMSAEENLVQQYRLLGLNSFETIPRLLKLVGLDGARNKKAAKFSLGMRQRLGIAVALAGDPEFLILDEPINGLDPQGITYLRELILKLNREMRITILISSHILGELSRLASFYGFIDNGKLVKEISAEELESELRQSTRVTVSSASVLASALDKMKLDYKILSDTEVDVFAQVSATKIVRALSGADCEVFSVTERAKNLESYYMELIGVESNA